MDSLGTSNWCEDPNLWVCHYYQRSCISDSLLTSYHDFILKFESLNLSHYLYWFMLTSHDDRENDTTNNIFLEIHDSDHFVIFWDQIVNSIASVTWCMNRTRKKMNRTKCNFMPSDLWWGIALPLFSSKIDSSCIQSNWKRVYPYTYKYT